MTSSTKKTILIALVIFATIVATIAVIYMVRKPTLSTTLPTPRPSVTTASVPSPVAAPILAIDPGSVCSQVFMVPCGSSSPSPSPSGSPSPSPSASAPVYPSSSPSAPPQASLSCVTKRMYQDDSRNRAGFYYLQNEITDTNTIQDGQTIVYNVLARNSGGNSAPDTTITDTLSNNLTFIDGDSGCTYDSTTRIVTCTIGALAGASDASRSFRARVTLSGSGATSVANTATVASTNGQSGTCSVRINATGQVITPPSSAPTALPVAGVFEVTAGTLGIGVLLLVAGALGLLLI